MLDEVALLDVALELLGGEEVVVDAVTLARPGLAGRRRHRQLELRYPLEQPSDQRPLPHPRRPGDHEHLGHCLGWEWGAAAC